MAAGVIGWCRVTDRASSFETLPATSRLSRVCGAEFNQQTLLAPVGWCVFILVPCVGLGWEDAVSSSSPPTSSSARLIGLGCMGSIPVRRPSWCRVAHGEIAGHMSGAIRKQPSPKERTRKMGLKHPASPKLFEFEQWVSRRDQRFRPPFTILFIQRALPVVIIRRSFRNYFNGGTHKFRRRNPAPVSPATGRARMRDTQLAPIPSWPYGVAVTPN